MLHFIGLEKFGSDSKKTNDAQNSRDRRDSIHFISNPFRKMIGVAHGSSSLRSNLPLVSEMKERKAEVRRIRDEA